MTDEDIEKIIKANMSLQMNLADIRQDFEEKTKREWVGLTDEELVALREHVQEYTPMDSVKYGEAIQRAMAQALKEKNT